MKKKVKSHLGITKGQEWILYRLRKGKADLELKENPFSGNRMEGSVRIRVIRAIRVPSHDFCLNVQQPSGVHP